ncbi:hypothetical protein TGRH88_002170 [Toxoplasma gondii]|uniref:Uncharacterized protein n=1 Tax=Toxoplasma gondii TaxID=5811 RepID=A0A7J6KGQ9_TOXGO|nr:hypothetical protein TGRH88_002170 [Toxoplasma gondii]
MAADKASRRAFRPRLCFQFALHLNTDVRLRPSPQPSGSKAVFRQCSKHPLSVASEHQAIISRYVFYKGMVVHGLPPWKRHFPSLVQLKVVYLP